MGHDVNKLSMLVMAVALPPAFSGIIISSRYNIYVKEGASTTAVSTVVFAIGGEPYRLVATGPITWTVALA